MQLDSRASVPSDASRAASEAVDVVLRFIPIKNVGINCKLAGKSLIFDFFRHLLEMKIRPWYIDVVLEELVRKRHTFCLHICATLK